VGGVAHPDGDENQDADGDAEQDDGDAEERGSRLVRLVVGGDRNSMRGLVGHRILL
jgi:hypothetical protein